MYHIRLGLVISMPSGTPKRCQATAGMNTFDLSGTMRHELSRMTSEIVS